MYYLSIIIVNYNTKDFLGRCLESIINNSGDANCEIIVVDNNSSDNSVSLVRKSFPTVKLIENENNLGFGKACNQGIKASKGNYIILLNSDCEVLKNTLPDIGQMIKNFDRSKRIGIIGGKILNPDGTIQYSYGKFPTVYSTILDGFKPPERRKVQISGYETAHNVDWVTGAFMIINRELFNDIGYFDEKYFMYYEETDLCFRAKAHDWQIKYDPSPQVIHKTPHASKKENIPFFIQVEIRNSHLYFFRKNRSYLSFLFISIASMKLLALKWCIYLFRNVKKRRETSHLISTVWNTFKELGADDYINHSND